MRRKENPIVWCSGCGLFSVFSQLINQIQKKKMEEITIVSGIGCAGRSSGYFDLDSVNTLHGRAIPVAEGLKLANPKLNVVVFSGDGDLLSIGLGHLIHSSRRDTKITVICANNSVYGMTGGQASPTTAKGTVTKTTPFGSTYEPINIQKLLMSNKRYFYARTTPFNIQHLSDCIESALDHTGFSFVEVVMPCITEQIRNNKAVSAADAMKHFKEDYSYSNENRELNYFEYGVNSKI